MKANLTAVEISLNQPYFQSLNAAYKEDLDGHVEFLTHAPSHLDFVISKSEVQKGLARICLSIGLEPDGFFAIIEGDGKIRYFGNASWI